jgi:uncharacterized protein
VGEHSWKTTRTDRLHELSELKLQTCFLKIYGNSERPHPIDPKTNFMRAFILLAILFFTVSLNAQNRASNEIVSNGSAKTKLKPDVAVMSFTIIKENPVESLVLKNLNLQINKLSSILLKMGFHREQITIAAYTLALTSDENDKTSYRATNTLTVEFRLDNKIIDQVYRSMEAGKLVDLDMDFETKVSDSLEKATRKRLTLLAIEDAKTSAENIATALNIKLGKVTQVQKYGEGSMESGKMEYVKFTPPMMVEDEKIQKTSFSDFDVEDVELEEQITVIYEIKQGV